MNKLLVSLLGLTMLAGCNTYDYYEGGVKYVQDGSDCIYYAGEQGRHFSNDAYSLDSGKKVVYRDTICASLYNKDTYGQAARQDRKILAPAAVETPCPCASGACGQQFEAPVYTAPTFGCKTCGTQPVMKRKYVIVSAM